MNQRKTIAFNSAMKYVSFRRWFGSMAGYHSVLSLICLEIYSLNGATVAAETLPHFRLLHPYRKDVIVDYLRLSSMMIYFEIINSLVIIVNDQSIIVSSFQPFKGLLSSLNRLSTHQQRCPTPIQGSPELLTYWLQGESGDRITELPKRCHYQVLCYIMFFYCIFIAICNSE